MQYTDEQWLERWEDQREIKNVMGKYSYCVLLNWEARVFDMLWAQGDDEVSLGFNGGYYKGAAAIRGYYQAVHERSDLAASILMRIFPEDLGGKTEEELHGVGVLRFKPIYCPVIDISKDGKTAKAVWLSAGSYADVYSYGPSSSWVFGYFDVDFVKQGDDWKIHKLLCVEDIDSRCGFSWGRPVPQIPDKASFAPLKENIIPAPNKPGKLREYYSADRPFAGMPALPNAWCAGAKAKNPQMQLLLDTEAVKNVMYSRSYYIGNDDRAGELNDLWVSEEKNKKTASFGRNWGWYVGLDAIRGYYVDAHNERLAEQMKTNSAPDLNAGNLYYHPATTGIVEIAGDGKTAKGVWYVIAQETIAKSDGTADARWYLEKVAADFIKEGDDWKIWHLVIAADLNCEAGEDYTKQPVYIDWEKDAVKCEFGKPTIEELIHDATFNWWDDYPPLPNPYNTYSDSISYGPDGWKRPTIRHLRAKEGRNYK